MKNKNSGMEYFFQLDIVPIHAKYRYRNLGCFSGYYQAFSIFNNSVNNAFKKYNSIAIVAHSMGVPCSAKSLGWLDEQNRNRIRYVFCMAHPAAAW